MMESPYKEHLSNGMGECKKCKESINKLVEAFKAFKIAVLDERIESKEERSAHMASYGLGIQIGLNLIYPENEEAHRVFVQQALLLTKKTN